jgi:hypothetical protein
MDDKKSDEDWLDTILAQCSEIEETCNRLQKELSASLKAIDYILRSELQLTSDEIKSLDDT